MSIYILWLAGIIIWNFVFPNASPLEDVIAAIVLSFLSKDLKKKVIQMKNKYFDNKK
tara:strand:- start:847 stop:1017 length:171 start_codon:yes stop_codon:yes gene_type:complete